MKYLLASLFFLFSSFQVMAGSLILLIDMSDSLDEKDKKTVKESYSRSFHELNIFHGVYIEVIEFGTYYTVVAKGDIETVKTEFDPELKYSIYESTCLEYPLQYIVDNLAKYPKPVVIDISSDGIPNCPGYKRVPFYLDFLEKEGVIVNTLYVGGLSESKNSIEFTRGNGSFSILIQNYADFEDALFRKLETEIAFLEN